VSDCQVTESQSREGPPYLEVILPDRFRVRMRMATRGQGIHMQQHRITRRPGCQWPRCMSYARPDQLTADATWRPSNHGVNRRSHIRQLNDVEETLIEDALNERSARRGKIDGKLAQIVVRQITLETRGVSIDICPPSMGRPMHRLMHCLGFSPRLPMSGAAKRRTRTRRLLSGPPWIASSHPPV
jgi:hypothetical protein